MEKLNFGNSRIILLILCAALLLRIANPFFGSPALYVVPDEVLNYLATFTMIKEKTLLTTSQYPPFGSYIQIPPLLFSFVVMRLSQHVHSLNDFLLFLSTHEGFFLFIPRVISALFGTASLIVVYQIGKLIFPSQKQIALWALMFSAFSITHLQISSLGKPNMPALFFLFIGIYYLCKDLRLKSSSGKQKVLSLVFFSLGGGFHFSSFFGVILYFLAYFVFYRKSPIFHRQNLISFTLLIIPLSFLVLLRFLSTGNYQPTFVETLNVLQYNLKWGLQNVALFYLKELIFTEPVLTLFLGLSVFTFRSWPKIFSALFSFSIIFAIYIIASFYHSLRFFLPAVLIWSLIAAFTLEYILVRLTVGKNILRATIFLLLLFPAILWTYRFITQPTFIQAKSWIEQNISPHTLITSTAVRFLAFTPDKTTISTIRLYDYNIYTQAYTYLPDSGQIENTRAIIYLDQIINTKDLTEITKFVNKHNVKYLIQPYWDPNQRLVKTEPQLFNLIQRFSPLQEETQEKIVKNVLHGSGDIIELILIRRFGPYIDILKIQS